MKQIKIQGGNILSGTISIGGAKNSAVALLPIAILTKEKVVINNVPNISDIDAIKDILEYLGARVEIDGNSFTIDCKDIENKKIREEDTKRLRASYYFMGSLLARFKKCTMSYPGGCPIGARPIDLHLTGFEAMGAKYEETAVDYSLEAEEFVGADLYVKRSVGATINLLFTAVLAYGTTTIHDAAKEPEITNIVDLLNKMGAKIEGRETDTLVINGVESLNGAEISVIPDRIEAGTYLIMGAMSGKDLVIDNIEPNHLNSLFNIFNEMGVPYKVNDSSVVISKTNELNPCDVVTEVYPGFPTDLQQPLTSLMTSANGFSTIKETIWENRFNHVPYLNKMGASITVENQKTAVIGPTELVGEVVKATDLRAGACLVIAGLSAKGITTITESEHILRGYEKIIEKLTNVGAKIELEEIQ